MRGKGKTVRAAGWRGGVLQAGKLLKRGLAAGCVATMGEAAEKRDRLRQSWFICAGLMLVAVLTWGAYTHHAWEDFYISFRPARNLAAGDGLVYQVGQRLHTFTSPLHTLALGALAFVTGAREDPAAVLWLYRALGGAFLGGAVFFLWRLGRAQAWPRVALFAGVGLAACDPKAIDFTASGMEPPLMWFFLALQLHALLSGAGWRQLGVAWAGLMWTRPDAFVFVGASILGVGALGCANWTERRELAWRVLCAGLLATALYGPWLLWATWYYGTPVPNTIVAKGMVHHEESVRELARRLVLSPWEMVTTGKLLNWIFAATYTRAVWDWGLPFHIGWRCLAYPVWLYWLNPWGGARGRAVSLAFFLATLYGANVPFAPWYAPSYALLAIVAWGFLFADLWRWAESFAGGTREVWRRRLQRAVAGLAIALVGVQAVTSLVMARTMRLQQELIETTHRREIGRWLRTQAKAGDTLFLECVGYIGFYSGLKTYDFPGLTSKEVVETRRRLGSDSYGELIRELKPEWLVLRPSEAEDAERDVPGLLRGRPEKAASYELVRVFDRTADVAALTGVRGRLYFEMDRRFEVYRRRASEAAPPEFTKGNNPRE